jgi:hypothetical protein
LFFIFELGGAANIPFNLEADFDKLEIAPLYLDLFCVMFDAFNLEDIVIVFFSFCKDSKSKYSYWRLIQILNEETWNIFKDYENKIT